MRELVTTLLDALGLLLVAAGAGLVVFGLATSAHGLDAVAAGSGTATAGGVVLAGVRLADWLAARAARAAARSRSDRVGVA